MRADFYTSANEDRRQRGRDGLLRSQRRRRDAARRARLPAVPGRIPRSTQDSGAFGPRCAEVWLNGENLGLIGRVASASARPRSACPSTRVCAAELRIRAHGPIATGSLIPCDLSASIRPWSRTWRSRWTRPCPTAPSKTPSAQPAAISWNSVELFDVYRGDPLPAGRKSLAYRLTYQSLDHSLREKEVAAIRKRIAAQVEQETGARLRSE